MADQWKKEKFQGKCHSESNQEVWGKKGKKFEMKEVLSNIKHVGVASKARQGLRHAGFGDTERAHRVPLSSKLTLAPLRVATFELNATDVSGLRVRGSSSPWFILFKTP